MNAEFERELAEERDDVEVGCRIVMRMDGLGEH